eukprot:4091967-Pyramimonas_sp.AAC.1
MPSITVRSNERTRVSTVRGCRCGIRCVLKTRRVLKRATGGVPTTPSMRISPKHRVNLRRSYFRSTSPGGTRSLA